MKYFLGIITLAVAIIISAIAGYFSIVGLAALFAARAIPVIIMGSALEVGKLVAATWLKLNWKERAVSWLHKGYLLIATLVLMLITSLGIFGFLSAGHLEQNAPLAGLSIQQQQYQVRLTQTEQANKRIEARLTQIDNNINAFLTNGAASKGLRASNSLKQERDQLQAEMDTNNKVINDLNGKLAPLKQQSTEVEAKLGPVKYLASAVGYDDPEIAVRLIILLIMIAFDPLAVVLIISAMATFKQVSEEKIKIEPEPEVINPRVAQINTQPQINVNANALHKKSLVTALGELADKGVFDSIEEEETALDPVRLTPREIADQMATPKPAYFAVGESIPVTINSNGVVEPMPAKDIRTQLIDMMEQYPEIVNDLLAAAKDMENAKAEADAEIPHNPTISNVTGATVDRPS